MITLPHSATLSRGPLRGFWLSVWLLLGAATGGSVSGGAARRTSIAAGIFATGGLAGLLRPSLARGPYLAWLAGSTRAARLATTYTAWVTHTTALPPGTVGAAGPSAYDRNSEVETNWLERDTQPAAAYRSPSWAPSHTPVRGGSLPALRRWIRDRQQPRQRWLLACLAMLRWLQSPEQPPDARPTAGETYSLY